MTPVLSIIIELLVAGLLAITIGYCILLDRRLKRLKADEGMLKATISELVLATEMAERAIAGLKLTVRDCDATLGDRLRTAERYTADMDAKLAEAEMLLTRLNRIISAGRPGGEAAVPPPAPAPQALAAPHASSAMLAHNVAAAQALAARARLRRQGEAA